MLGRFDAVLLASFISLCVGVLQAGPNWRVNQNCTLIWDGKPYLPVGARIAGDQASIKFAAEAGIKDVILDVEGDGRGWAESIAVAENAGMRYILAPSGLMPTASYYAVEPQGFRIAKITETREIDIAIPGAQSALCVLVTQRDSDVEKAERAAVVNGRLKLTVNPKNDLDHVLLIYPEIEDGQIVDYYEGFDERRDLILSSLQNAKPGVGFRGLLNPLGKRHRYPDESAQTIPSSRLFRAELEDFLRKKYTSPDTCMKSWALNAPSVASFDELARLVPLWSTNRGISQLWDPQTDHLHPCESKKSLAWDDIRAVKRQSAARRFDRLVNSLQSAAKVPVILDWAGWNGPYSANRITLGGLGMLLGDASQQSTVLSAGAAAATALGFERPIWFVATNIGDINASTAETIEHAFRTAADLGARAWFVRLANDAAAAKRIAQISAQFSNDDAYAQWRPTALLYPETAMNPAVTKDLGGGKWWLPAPGSGSRLDLGSEFAGYTYSNQGLAFSAVWSLKGERRVLMHIADSKFVKVEGLNGFDPKPRVVKKGIEVTIGEAPIIISGADEAPIPDPSYKETLVALERIMLSIEKAGVESAEEKLEFRDSFNGFDRAPYGAYLAMRRQLRRLTATLGATIWLEAEVSRDHTFSEPISAPGATANGVLSLRPRISDPKNPFRATYSVGVRVDGLHHVYLAGRFPNETWKLPVVKIGDQILQSPNSAISFYGSGLAWYSLGKVELGKGMTKLTVEIPPSVTQDIDLDAIVLSPGAFVPDGVRTPELKFDSKPGS